MPARTHSMTRDMATAGLDVASDVDCGPYSSPLPSPRTRTPGDERTSLPRCAAEWLLLQLLDAHTTLTVTHRLYLPPLTRVRASFLSRTPEGGFLVAAGGKYILSRIPNDILPMSPMCANGIVPMSPVRSSCFVRNPKKCICSQKCISLFFSKWIT